MGLTEFILGIGLVSALLYIWCKRNYSYWQRHGIPFMKPLPFIGNTSVTFTMKNSFGLHLSDIYSNKKVANDPVVGIYVFHKPGLVIRDPELVKSVLIKDFNKFSNRYAASDPHKDALGAQNLFFVKNPYWREMRQKLTPVFTSGKLKQMYPLMSKIGSNLEKHINSNIKVNGNYFIADIKDISANFTTDSISTIAFGLEANSLKNPNNEFRENGRKVFNFTIWRAKDFFVAFFLPEWTTFFRAKTLPNDFTAFIRRTIGFTMKERKNNGIIRNDLIDILLALQKDSNTAVQMNESKKLDNYEDFLIAQAAVFFTAGFETSSSAMSFGLYELAKQPDLQQKLREEICDAFLTENGTISYEKIQNLEYLGMVLDEVLRMYPVLPFLDREYTGNKGDYTLEPHYKFAIPEGMPIYIPVYGIQRDPQYWPNPNKFDPERFSIENKKNINQMTYMPFGNGPHNCIGNRTGLLQAKMGLVHILKNHHVEFCEKTVPEIKFDPKAIILQNIGGIYLKVVQDNMYENKI